MPGSDLVLPLCRLARDQGLPLGFVGSTDEALSGAGAAMTGRFAGLKLALTFAPAMGFDPEGPQACACLADLATLGPRCVSSRSAPRNKRFLPPLAARSRRKWVLLRSGRAWTFCRATRPARHRLCGSWRWNGYGAPCPRRAVWCRAMPLVRPFCPARCLRPSGSEGAKNLKRPTSPWP